VPAMTALVARVLTRAGASVELPVEENVETPGRRLDAGGGAVKHSTQVLTQSRHDNLPQVLLARCQWRQAAPLEIGRFSRSAAARRPLLHLESPCKSVRS